MESKSNVEKYFEDVSVNFRILRNFFLSPESFQVEFLLSDANLRKNPQLIEILNKNGGKLFWIMFEKDILNCFSGIPVDLLLKQKSIESFHISRDLLIDSIRNQSTSAAQILLSDDRTIVRRKTVPILRKPDEKECTIYVVSVYN